MPRNYQRRCNKGFIGFDLYRFVLARQFQSASGGAYKFLTRSAPTTPTFPTEEPNTLKKGDVLPVLGEGGKTVIRNCAKVRRIYDSKLKFPGAYVMARRQQSKRPARRLTATKGGNLLYYRAHIREACQNNHVICLECGLSFKSLPQHLCKHHLTDAEYKVKWGYNRTTPLVAGTTWRGLRRRALAMNLAAYSPPHSLRKALKARRGRRSPYRPEQRLAQIDVARSRNCSRPSTSQTKKEKHYPTCHGRSGSKDQNYRP